MARTFFTDKYTIKSFQDEGHTGHLHNASSFTDKHYGMFIFDFTDDPNKYINFQLVLSLQLKSVTITGNKKIGDVIFGTFLYPEMISQSTFLTDADLSICGFTPIRVQNDSSGTLKDVSIPVYSNELNDVRMIKSAIFTHSGGYLGCLFSPEVLQPGEQFSISFYTSSDHMYQPTLKCQNDLFEFDMKDIGGGKDTTGYLTPELIDNTEFVKGFDFFKATNIFSKYDSGVLTDVNEKPLKIKGTDVGTNYSMVIHSILLKEKAKCVEIYGFNGYTDRYYYPDFVKAFEKVEVTKYNYVSWSGILIEKPWISMLWYGEIYFFAYQEEFGACCRRLFDEYAKEKCPVCGKLLTEHLRFSFIDVTRIPHQIWFCSDECMHRFESQIMFYLNALTRPNADYLGKVKW